MFTGQTPLVSLDTTQLTIDQAKEAAQRFLERTGNPDLEVKEIMEFSNHFYIEIYEKSTGLGAFEMLADKYTGALSPEPGPNMMWNTKYSVMMHRNFSGTGGMMGRVYGYQGVRMTVDQESAKRLTQEYLDTTFPGTEAGEVATFYGYYTVHVLRKGEVYGMLSVEGHTGQVWYHSWHGTFVALKEYTTSES